MNLALSDGYWDDAWFYKNSFTSWGGRPADQFLNEAWRSGADWNESHYANPDLSRLAGRSAGKPGYGQPRGLNRLFDRKMPKPVVQGVSFQLARSEILSLVGESGSGNSTILRAIAGILEPSSGTVRLANGGKALTPLAKAMGNLPLAQLRRVQMVFQNPETSLNPRHTIFEILAQPLRNYGTSGDLGLWWRAQALLAEVRLDQGFLDRYPAQLSGGERQRVAIARAFAADPEILPCDEITTALDVSVQAAVLRLVRDLARDHQVATIFV